MKILITGNAGSGKSTLAKRLSMAQGLPYVSLDGIVWQEGWKKTPREVRKQAVARQIAQENWVIDGVDYDVLGAADTVVFLDYPRRVCMDRALKRNIPYLFSSRPELPRNCPEILILPQLLRIIWRFPKKIRPKVLAVKASRAGSFVHIQSNAELKNYLEIP